MSSFYSLQKIYKFLRFVEDLESSVSDVLEELVYREDIKMHLLSPVWASGLIKQSWITWLNTGQSLQNLGGLLRRLPG